MRPLKPPPGFLVPARNSKHRIACIALYRALLRQAESILVPKTLIKQFAVTESYAIPHKPDPRPGGQYFRSISPIVKVIRKSFRRNLQDTSPRILYPALQFGYSMMSRLKAAQKPRSYEHQEIISYLIALAEERRVSFDAHEDWREVNPPPDQMPKRPPFLVNVTPEPTPENPSPALKYAIPGRPMPFEELGGRQRRHVAQIEMAGDFPFLRIGKPESHLLSMAMRNKMRRKGQRMRMIEDYSDEMMADAQEEDAWELGLFRLMREEGQGRPGGSYDAEDDDYKLSQEEPEGPTPQSADPNVERRALFHERRDGATYTANVWLNIRHLQQAVDDERKDNVARANAMRQVVKQEQAMYDAELAERREKRAVQMAEGRERREEKKKEMFGEYYRPDYREFVEEQKKQRFGGDYRPDYQQMVEEQKKKRLGERYIPDYRKTVEKNKKRMFGKRYRPDYQQAIEEKKKKKFGEDYRPDYKKSQDSESYPRSRSSLSKPKSPYSKPGRRPEVFPPWKPKPKLPPWEMEEQFESTVMQGARDGNHGSKDSTQDATF
ncbi:hypothetical protein F4780DRAFT_782910 [Xylariomycetidae sp. FL0641]|nr:hypothetical protein F4780DRAFT_782910 [Xylariomycetidae sp. FL0641]